jgi:hypothetical protein
MDSANTAETWFVIELSPGGEVDGDLPRSRWYRHSQIVDMSQYVSSR